MAHQVYTADRFDVRRNGDLLCSVRGNEFDAARDAKMIATALNVHQSAALETAACLWEAVLEMESVDAGDLSTEPQRRAQAIHEAREAIGSSGLRLTVIGWIEACDAAWQAVDDPTGGCPGQYGETFDWDFVPGWIIENVDWSDPCSPTLRKQFQKEA